MDVATLYDAVVAVCPIPLTGVTVGDPDDRSTWSYEPLPEATTEEIAAADNVLATIPVEVLPQIYTRQFLEAWTDAEYLALLQLRQDRIAAGELAFFKQWDMLVASDVVNPNKPQVQAFMTELVTAGVLSQERVREITEA